MAPSSPFHDPLFMRGVHARVKTLLNKHLIRILKEENLSHSGVKAIMQERLFTHMETLRSQNKIDRLEKLRNMIYNPDSIPDTSPRYPPPAIPAPSPTTPRYPVANNAPPYLQQQQQQPQYSPHPPYPAMGRLVFHESPFVSILDPLSTVERCAPTHGHRNSVACRFRIRQDVIDRLKADPALRIMVYCAVDAQLSMFTRLDISFPFQVELKVNGVEVKANFRGLKNKPGSTKPVDITPQVRLIENFENLVVMTYAMTTQRYSFVVNLVRKRSIDELVNNLRQGKSITKEQVIRDMTSKAQDSDVQATSTVMSLKCPVSTLRIQLACRSYVCSHNQCFDAASFLQLQEQAPTWTCPVCQKPISFEALLVDQYVTDILANTSRSVEQVTIEPNGQWSDKVASLVPSNSHDSSFAAAQGLEDDDDVLEVQPVVRVREVANNGSTVNSTTTTTTTAPAVASAPTSAPVTPSAAPSARASASAAPPSATSSSANGGGAGSVANGTAPSSRAGSVRKAPKRTLIDLTQSDDEDEAAAAATAAAKRPALSFSLPNRLPSAAEVVAAATAAAGSPYAPPLLTLPGQYTLPYHPVFPPTHPAGTQPRPSM